MNPYREGSEKLPTTGPISTIVWEGDVRVGRSVERNQHIRIVKIFDGKIEKHVVETLVGKDSMGAYVWTRSTMIDSY